MEFPTEKDCWLALQHAEGMNPKAFFGLLNHFGDARSAWSAPASKLADSQALTPAVVQGMHKARTRVRAEGLTERLARQGIQSLIFHESEYPEVFRALDRPPPVLFFKGDVPNPEKSPLVAVVGSRRCTGYGRDMAREIGSGLARAGVTVVSGLAQGIDTEAHEGALEGGGKTWAVLGGGIDQIYPASNQHLADRIAQSGSLMTEFAPGAAPERWNFPFRNRLIGALSRAVVIVEGTEKSGAMITCNLALDMGREVFAVPGNAKSALSAGPHRIVRDGGRLVSSAGDILEDLGLAERNTGQTGFEFEPELTDLERKIYDAVSDSPTANDHLASQLDVDAAKLSGTLLMLEMKGLIRQLPGRMVVRIALTK